MKYIKLLLLAAIFAASSSASILINGGFEDPVFEDGITTIQAGELTLAGWDVWEGEVSIYTADVFPVLAGRQSLLFNSGVQTEIEQVFPTDPGIEYTLSIWLACSSPSSSFSLAYELWDYEKAVEGVWTTTSDTSGPQQFAINYTAAATLAGLILRTVDGSGDGSIDDVDILVPEPGLSTMFGAVGLIALACFRKLRA